MHPKEYNKTEKRLISLKKCKYNILSISLNIKPYAQSASKTGLPIRGGVGGRGGGGSRSGILKQFHTFITSFAKPVFEKI